MTETATPRPSLGRALGEAARKVGKLHRRALADFDTGFPDWMLLTLLAERTSPMPVHVVVAEMNRRMDLPEAAVISLLKSTAAAGHIDYQPNVPMPTAELTEEGEAHFASLYAHARRTTDAASDGIDPDLLDTAVTVLLAVDERATLLLDS
uniref:MarR family transcriptional regulator n=1 Tax=Microbispora corallina TaxID=83302 RepID=E2IHD7_9ACTN|nr:hypothetical protein [Microbispora corallina]